MDGVQLHVARCGENVLVSVRPPADGQRQPVDVCCVIDILYPDKEAQAQKTGVEEDQRGFTVMDIAKHAVRTIVHALQEQDRFSLVALQGGDLCLMPLTSMNQSGQTTALEKLDSLKGAGSGDTWESLQHALEVLRCDIKPGSFSHVMLMTDAPFDSIHRPNVLPSLEAYRTKHGTLPGTINTLGFGYRIDGKLLPQIANIGNGSHSFVPDVGMVGTACIHLLANLLVTMALHVQVQFSLENGAALLDEGKSAVHGYSFSKDGDLFCLSLGTLQLGQTKDIILHIASKDMQASCVTVSGQYMESSGQLVQLAPVSTPSDVSVEEAPEVEFHRCRRLLIDALPAAAQRELHENLEKAQESIKELGEGLCASPLAGSDDRLKALIEDITGQSTEAFSCSEWYDKWGFRYMPSLLSAHKLQQCNNFKDPGVQIYGGDIFLSIRDAADDIFNSLPAPLPSRPAVSTPAPVRTVAAYNVTGYVAAPPAVRAPVRTMAAYNDRFGG